MNSSTTLSRRRSNLAALLFAGAVIPGIISSCDDRLIGLTRYVDPCGTILANCNPGDFEVNAAGIGDFCVDPACTVPGGCGGGQPLGTITDVCP